MDYSYIIASVPMLRFGEKPLISLDDFRQSCSMLTALDALELELVLDNRAAEGVSEFCEQWVNADTQLRCAIARARSETAGADAGRFQKPYTGYSVLTQKNVEDAIAEHDPLKAEQIIDRRRWALLEEIELADPFGLKGVLAYAVKLQILWRWASLDDEKAGQVMEELIVNNLNDEGAMARFLEVES